MTTVLVASTLNQLVVDIFVQEWHTNDCLALTDNEQVHKALAEIGIHSTLVNPYRRVSSWAERDKEFAAKFMPGILGERALPGTDLPFWKVLALDRLNFWYRAVDLPLPRFDRAVIALTLDSPLPFLFMDCPDATGIQGEFMLTEEWFCAAPLFDFPVFLGQENERLPFPQKNLVGNLPKPSVAKTVQMEQKYVGLVFDKRYEWQFRRTLEQMNLDKVRVFVLDDRSRELYTSCIPNGPIISPLSLWNACKVVYTFCPYDIAETHIVIDYFGLFSQFVPNCIGREELGR